jgi:hypothetical protein
MLGGLDARRLLSANSGWFLIFFATDTHGLAQTLLIVCEFKRLIVCVGLCAPQGGSIQNVSVAIKDKTDDLLSL